MATKPNGKSPVSSASDEKVMFFRDVSLGPHKTQLRFRLIHFWEAWNPIKKTLISLEMLLIDEQGTVIQGFISPGRIEKYLPTMKRGTVYKLNNFYGSSNKSVYRVSDHAVTVSFSWNSELSVLQDITTPFDEDRFQFHSYEVFEANCDLKVDLYDVVGHMKLVNGHTLTELSVLDEVQIAAARHLLVHVQLHESQRSSAENSSHAKPLPPCYWSRPLGSNPKIAGKVNAEVEAFFECTATIDDVFHGSAWYYIACSGCNTKATKGPTSLMCAKCGKVNIAGVAQYCARLSVYENSDQTVFVLLGDAGRALT
ncbi:hypothetical protein DY000_02020276 [Brassica cretica]|uniref:Replication protein A 70 kDa DNA-binding subunit B/D first OB fold domain-containing protein n=1 Tax=Brassica cretica TaxID=69181 RepID=A0ABQ7E9C0_BRACR|nr:hypothetical protein DY000_02020276 [Brassica cretica]